jgi:hypothetical protein
MTQLEFMKFTFGISAIIGFFSMIVLLFITDIENDLIVFMLGQASTAFILVFRHVFKTVKEESVVGST